VVSFTSWPFHPQVKRPRYPLDRRLGGSQSASLDDVEKRIFVNLLGLEL
jgi:hypothetical protein